MKRKISTPIGTAILLLFILPFVFIFNNAISADTQPKPAPVTKVVRAEPDPITVERLHELVNQERSKLGIPELQLDDKLNASALAKCEHMTENGYWGHDSPDGVTPWYFIEEQGLYNKSAGENLARSYYTSTAVIKGWLRSEGHKANIINQSFNTVGYGICYIDRYMEIAVVQHFADQK